jgi:acyl carrier protein
MFFPVKVTNRQDISCKFALCELRLVNETMTSQGQAPRARHAMRGLSTVLDPAAPNMRQRVAELVRQLLAKRAIERAVGADDDLGESGLSSLDIVNLMLAVESEFDLKIPERDMRPANFRTIARIEALVASLMDQSASVGG